MYSYMSCLMDYAKVEGPDKILLNNFEVNILIFQILIKLFIEGATIILAVVSFIINFN